MRILSLIAILQVSQFTGFIKHQITVLIRGVQAIVTAAGTSITGTSSRQVAFKTLLMR
jgi:hypothetical protein